jgi:hypothetical protein
MASIWTYIEPSLGVISATLPFLSGTMGNRVRIVVGGARSVYERTILRKTPEHSTNLEASGKSCTILVELSPLPKLKQPRQYSGTSSMQATASTQSFV